MVFLGRIRPLIVAASLLVLVAMPVEAVRLKDIARVDVSGDAQLVGYGLVVGLDGTGDSQMSEITRQSMGNVLEHMGVLVPDHKIRLRNTAAVMVVARMSRHHHPGATVDVTVSSLGDARSLEGGTLLNTALGTPDGIVHVVAQGPVSVGGFDIRGGGRSRARRNYVLSGRVPAGGIVERALDIEIPATITIVLFHPDFTTAQRVVEAINRRLGSEIAQPQDAATIVVDPSAASNTTARVSLLAQIESVEVEPDAAARVVMNEKTGTVVAGDNVSIASVAIAHGNLSVQVRGEPLVSQPAPFSEQGETVAVETTEVDVHVGDGGLHPMPAAANVGDLARALNALGVAPRDMIAIFQALKEAGALRAELRII